MLLKMAGFWVCSYTSFVTNTPLIGRGSLEQ